MAVSTNFLLNQVAGTLNKQIVIRRWRDRVLICQYPDMSFRKLSKDQKHTVNLMKEANEEWYSVRADEKLLRAARQRLDVPSNKLYHAFIGEYIKRGKEIERSKVKS